MAEPAGQPNSTALPWWVRASRVGWKGVRYFWATFLLTLVLPNAVEMLFSEKPLRSLPNLWPILEAIIGHPLWTLLTFLGLLLLTGLFWLGSHQHTATPQRALSEHDRVYMLKRLRFRYEQMLAQSLQGVVQIELGLASRSAAVQNVASLSLHLPDQPEQLLPPHTSIIEAYELAQQELLILGKPGAGKSTLLLELAHHLACQAEQDTTQPLPVLLPLSSWATKQRPLQEWLIEQFAQLYNVPQKLSQQWIAAGQLLPLLDGLDEMEEKARADGIVAINSYHKDDLGPLVVCSRISEYETAARQEKLSLHTAIVVQPLLPAQVDTHLGTLGKPLVALRAALRKNPVLQEIATTPLMLQVLTLTYHGTALRALSHKQAQLQEQIWTDYVQRMISRKGDAKRYPLAVTTTWLGWLARQMRAHNQAIFFLERLQLDWLPKRQSTFYQLLVGLLFGLLGGLLFGLLGGLLFGLLGGLLFGLFFGLDTKIEPADVLTWSWKGSVFWPLGGLLWGVPWGELGGLPNWLPWGQLFGLLGWLLGVLLFGPLVGLFFGLFFGLDTKIEPAEVLTWSWKGSVSWLLVVLLFWLLGGLVGWLLGVLLDEPLFWLVVVLLWGQLGGQLAGQLAGLLGGLLGGQLNWPLDGLLFGLVVGLLAGLKAPLQHYLLRCWLWRSHCLPLRAVPFLEDATARILLRRVGRGYSFPHRLLLDYFADLDAHASPTSTAVSPITRGMAKKPPASFQMYRRLNQDDEERTAP